MFQPGFQRDAQRESRLGTDSLVPQDPLILGGGTISTDPSNLFVRNSSLTSLKGTSFPIQESRRTAAAATPTPTIQKMGTEMGTKVGTEAPQIKDKDNEEIFLVLPSYAEPYSRKIQRIILAEKQKLCKHKQCNAIFSSIKIRLAFTNNKNIKKLVFRTKI